MSGKDPLCRGVLPVVRPPSDPSVWAVLLNRVVDRPLSGPPLGSPFLGSSPIPSPCTSPGFPVWTLLLDPETSGPGSGRLPTREHAREEPEPPGVLEGRRQRAEGRLSLVTLCVLV